MKFITSKLGCFILFSLLITKLAAQTLPDSISRKVDSLFLKWNSTKSPGCAIGIVRNDSLIYAKGYGMANLEFGIPITPETIFNMASVSKQITAYGIVLLAKQGKINLDEDIHKYLLWVPDFGKRITVRNLLNHTSGLREHTSLAKIAGLGINGVLTPNVSLNLLKKQTALNFNPGEKYQYCNSNYVLLAEIIQSVSGKSFREFEDSAILKPLRMTHSHFHDNYTELILNRAASYKKADSNRYANNFQTIYTAGPGGLFSNVNDMANWIMNFYNHKVGDQKDIQQLTQSGKLNNNKKMAYALGINVGIYKGWQEFSHSGSNAGYENFLTVFPDLKMGFVFLSNSGDINSYVKAHEMADLFVKDTTLRSEPLNNKRRDSTAAVLQDPTRIKLFLGNYISEEGDLDRFEMKEGKLYNIYDNASTLLSQETKDTFSSVDVPSIKYIFRLQGKDTTFVLLNGDEIIRSRKYISDTSNSSKLLQEYTGTFFSPELDCIYSIFLKDHQLVLTTPKYNDAKLSLIGIDHLINNDYNWMRYLKIIRDSQNKVLGFEVNGGGVMHLQFNKIK